MGIIFYFPYQSSNLYIENFISKIGLSYFFLVLSGCSSFFFGRTRTRRCNVMEDPRRREGKCSCHLHQNLVFATNKIRLEEQFLLWIPSRSSVLLHL